VAAAATAGLAAALAACGGPGGPEAVSQVGVAPRPGASSTPSPPSQSAPAPASPDDSPRALASHLASIEGAIRNPATPASRLDELGREQQGAYLTLFRHPEWQAEVTALVPAAVAPAVRANLLAARELAQLARPHPELPKWRIVAPTPAAELLADYKAAQAAQGVPWEALAAIHLVETKMGRIRGASAAGAQGPMQFLPSTWAIYGAGGDINSNRDSILAAARLLRSKGGAGAMDAALFAYNPSQHYVRAVEAYAGLMKADERAYLAYHGWQVYYGDRLLPEGFVG